MLTGAQTSTASPAAFAVAFSAMFAIRLWGSKRLMRGHIRWSSAFALRVFRVPVGLACVWWLITRKTLQFEVTPKGGSHERLRGRAPNVLWVLLTASTLVLAYAIAGVLNVVPWSADASSTMASGIWLAMVGGVMIAGTMRIRAAEFATSRRNAHRVAVHTNVAVDGVEGELLDVSVGGVGIRLPTGLVPVSGMVLLELPGAAPIKLEIARISTDRANSNDSHEFVSLRVAECDWAAFGALALWMFHTPPRAVPGLPAGVPIVGCRLTAPSK